MSRIATDTFLATLSKQSQQQQYPWLLPSAWIHTHLE